MLRFYTPFFICLMALFGSTPLCGQGFNHFLQPSDTLNPSRMWLLAGSGTAAYTAASVGLWRIWYRDYPQGTFHFFDDRGEWEHVDKAGHLFTTYAESRVAFQSLRWAGVSPKPAAWIGAGIGTLLQGTIETLDGFSAHWGFSVTDFAFNTAGASLFLGQELLWADQRIQLKVSHTRPTYGQTPIQSQQGVSKTLAETAQILYGRFPASFFKDYNGMTIWASVNPASFLRRKRTGFPAWLNLSIGYGADNVFGAYGNAITDTQGNVFYLTQYPRYRQFYLSLDADLRRIPTQSRVLRTLFTALSWVKWPAPTLEWNTQYGFKGYGFYW